MAYPRPRSVESTGPVLPGRVPVRTSPDLRVQSLGAYGAYGEDGLGFSLGKTFKKIGKGISHAAKQVEKHVTRPVAKGVTHGVTQIIKHPLEAAAIAAGAGFLSPFAAPILKPLVNVASKIPGVGKVASGFSAVGHAIARVPGVSTVGKILKPVGKVAASPYVLGAKAGQGLINVLTRPSAPKPAPLSAPILKLPPQTISTPPYIEPGSIAASAPMIAPLSPSIYANDQSAAIAAQRDAAAAAANDANARLATLQAGLQTAQASGASSDFLQDIQNKIKAVSDTADRAGQLVNLADQNLANFRAQAAGEPAPYPNAPPVDESGFGSLFTNPLVWGGGLLVLYMLTQKKGGASSGRSSAPRRRARR